MVRVSDPRHAAMVPFDDPDLVIGIDSATVTRGEAELLRAVSWRVELDERWVVLGPNGAGKTTLLNLAAARLFPTRGTVHVLGELLGRVDVTELRTRIGLTTVALHDRIPPDESGPRCRDDRRVGRARTVPGGLPGARQRPGARHCSVSWVHCHWRIVTTAPCPRGSASGSRSPGR